MKILRFTVVLTLVSLLCGFKLPDILGKGDTTDSVEAPAWADEPLVKELKCDTFTWENISSFTEKYEQTKLQQEQLEASTGVDSKAKADLAAKAAMETYMLASILVNRSQLCLAEALELKETTDLLIKEKEILLGGTSLSKKEIKKHREYSQEAGQAIRDKADAAESLKPEQRKNFTLGTATYLAGVEKTSDVTNDIIKYANAAGSSISDSVDDKPINKNLLPSWVSEKTVELGGLFNKSARSLKHLSAGLKDHLAGLYENSKFLMRYTKQQDLDLPADATMGFDWDEA